MQKRPGGRHNPAPPAANDRIAGPHHFRIHHRWRAGCPAPRRLKGHFDRSHFGPVLCSWVHSSSVSQNPSGVRISGGTYPMRRHTSRRCTTLFRFARCLTFHDSTTSIWCTVATARCIASPDASGPGIAFSRTRIFAKPCVCSSRPRTCVSAVRAIASLPCG